MTEAEEIIEVAMRVQPQHYMLTWLAKEDSSAYGECEGRDFDALHSAMLVELIGPASSGHSRVRLTPLGHKVEQSTRIGNPAWHALQAQARHPAKAEVKS